MSVARVKTRGYACLGTAVFLVGLFLFSAPRVTAQNANATLNGVAFNFADVPDGTAMLRRAPRWARIFTASPGSWESS